MVKRRIRGARNFHVADVTENTETNYVATEPKRSEKLVGISMDVSTESEEVYSDDETEETMYGASKVTGTVTVNYLTNESKKEFFGGEIDSEGVYYPPAIPEEKHKAIGFEAPIDSLGNLKKVWLYDVLFEMPGEKAETQEGKPKPQTVEIKFSAYNRKNYNTYKADVDTCDEGVSEEVKNNWFEKVRDKVTSKTI